MLSEDIKAHLGKSFAPFRLVTTSGSAYEVQSADGIELGAGSVVVKVGIHPVRISMLHIERIEPTAPAETPFRKKA